MDIGFYIAELLRKQDKVGVPGLGTFARHKVQASFDTNSNTFLPPSYEVSFTTEFFESQSLSEYISLKKNLSPSSAEYFIKKFTSGVLDILQNSGIANLNPLGNFQQNNENLTFEPSSNFEIAGKFYGLKPVSDLTSIAHTAVESVATPPVLQGGFIEDFIKGEGSDDEIEEEEVYEEEKGRSNTLLIFLGAFLFAVVAAAMLYIFNPTTRNLVDRMLPGFITNTPIPETEKVSSSNPEVLPDSLSMIPPAAVPDSSLNDSLPKTEPIIEKAEPDPAPVADITKIEIIGATFGKRSEAEAYVKAMQKRGYQAKIADDMPGKLFKVSLASFNDEQGAQTELNRIVREVEKTAWIAKYKSKKNQ